MNTVDYFSKIDRYSSNVHIINTIFQKMGIQNDSLFLLLIMKNSIIIY